MLDFGDAGFRAAGVAVGGKDHLVLSRGGFHDGCREGVICVGCRGLGGLVGKAPSVQSAVLMLVSVSENLSLVSVSDSTPRLAVEGGESGGGWDCNVPRPPAPRPPAPPM